MLWLGLGLADATLAQPAVLENETEWRKPGTIRMAARLERLIQEMPAMENPYRNSERAIEMEKRLRDAPAGTDMTRARYLLAAEMLAAGRNEEALAQFNQVRAELDATDHPNIINVELNRALSYLRIAEATNCLTNHTRASCIVPIAGAGIHQWQDGSRGAMGVLTNFLAAYPENMPGRWLLNLACMTVGDYPEKVPARWLIPPEAFASDYDIKPFVDIAGPLGIDVNELSGGSVTEDFDGDGFLDIMVTSIGLRDQMRVYRNNGDGTFTERTVEAGLSGLVGGLNLVSADYDNDGHVDVLVLRGAWMEEAGQFPNSLLRNLGDGTFEDVTEAAGLLSFRPTQTAAWFDFDGDGWLDLFIGNESVRRGQNFPCELYRNNRDGTFTEMAEAAGVNVTAYVKGVAAGDYNNDGRPDLYLSIQHRGNMLFRNDGPKPDGWRFTETAFQAGVSRPTSSFPVWFFDFDNDGWEDLYVGGYSIRNVGDIAADYLGLPSKGERSKLYRNRGDGTFEDVSQATGLNRVLHAMGANYGDLDNDGWLDFYLGTGDPDLLTVVPNRMFRNAEGVRFQDVTTSGGFGNIQKGHGVSFADLDHDGDQDVYHEMGGAVSGDIYPNALFLNPGHGHRWLKVQLNGVRANKLGLGARLKVSVETPRGARLIYRTLSTGGSFGCNPLRLEIGLGDATRIESLEIRWPGSGLVQNVEGLSLDNCYRITEGVPVPERVLLKSFTWPLSKPHSHETHLHAIEPKSHE